MLFNESSDVILLSSTTFCLHQVPLLGYLRNACHDGRARMGSGGTTCTNWLPSKVFCSDMQYSDILSASDIEECLEIFEDVELIVTAQ